MTDEDVRRRLQAFARGLRALEIQHGFEMVDIREGDMHFDVFCEGDGEYYNVMKAEA